VRVEFDYPGDDAATDRDVLIYVRNGMTAESPWDVKAHHEAAPRFPHNSTTYE
jgi:hypothetical protein